MQVHAIDQLVGVLVGTGVLVGVGITVLVTVATGFGLFSVLVNPLPVSALYCASVYRVAHQSPVP